MTADPPHSASRAPRFSLTVVGEIRVDIRVRLDSLRFGEIDTDQLRYSPVQITPAGVALGLARQAVRYFDRVELIARIGRDEFTETILAELAELGIECRLTFVEGASTGRVLVVRDSAPRDGVRLMVSEPLSDAQVLSPADVRTASRAVASADVLFLTGYELLYPRSAEAVHEAAAIARSHGTLVCLDMVPHDIHLRLDSRLLLSTLRLADIVVGEAGTLASLVGETCASPAHLLPHLDRALDDHPVWLIRSGSGNVSRSTIYRHGLIHHDYATGYQAASDPMGFGDRLTARELHWLLSCLPLAGRSAQGSSPRKVSRKRSRVANVP
ncbi:hypothetical protein GCM10012289_22040 [Nonomuraea cavernae]|uniref:Carbohydrate kinase PfkB domain-containing protein n=1 Tax=Nonomuraea cavernae TaxID=2045107 RepID=A0A918DIZ8_9ACTN|nr:hypothetical protein GCM10012289_22040 [Nonomuraea cavernae]